MISAIIGKTPLLKLERLSERLGINLFAKAEHLNPGGSHKDRLYNHLIDVLEKQGEIKKGSVLVDYTRGSSGIALAMWSAVRGYDCCIVIPPDYPDEFRLIAQRFGAYIKVSQNGSFDPSKKGGVWNEAIELCKKHDNYFLLDQMNNPENVRAFFSCAEEVIDEAQRLGIHFDYFVSSYGTGGLYNAFAEILSAKYPDIKSFIVSSDMPEPLGIDAENKPVIEYATDQTLIPEGKELIFAGYLAQDGILGGSSSWINIAGIAQFVSEGKIKAGSNVLTVIYDEGIKYLNYYRKIAKYPTYESIMDVFADISEASQLSETEYFDSITDAIVQKLGWVVCEIFIHDENLNRLKRVAGHALDIRDLEENGKITTIPLRLKRDTTAFGPDAYDISETPNGHRGWTGNAFWDSHLYSMPDIDKWMWKSDDILQEPHIAKDIARKYLKEHKDVLIPKEAKDGKNPPSLYSFYPVPIKPLVERGTPFGILRVMNKYQRSIESGALVATTISPVDDVVLYSISQTIGRFMEMKRNRVFVSNLINDLSDCIKDEEVRTIDVTLKSFSELLENGFKSNLGRYDVLVGYISHIARRHPISMIVNLDDRVLKELVLEEVLKILKMKGFESGRTKIHEATLNKKKNLLCAPLFEMRNRLFAVIVVLFDGEFTAEERAFLQTSVEMLNPIIHLTQIHEELEQEKLKAEIENKIASGLEIGKTELIPLFGSYIGNMTNRKNRELKNLVELASKHEIDILLTGESGTGKGLIALAIHYNSSRSDEKFRHVNMGAFPQTLLESHLFGHEKGAFTGADKQHIGIFENTQGGTVFLDEIAELSPESQVKLFRAVDEKKVTRLGGDEDIDIDVRIITATNQDLYTMMKERSFREELYGRIHGMHIETVPLRRRREDIFLLTDYFVQKYNVKHKKKILKVDKNALEILLNHDWKRSNVRDLETTIENSVIFNTNEIISPEDLPKDIIRSKRITGELEMVIESSDEVTIEGNIVELEKYVQNEAMRLVILKTVLEKYFDYKIKRHKGNVLDISFGSMKEFGRYLGIKEHAGRKIGDYFGMKGEETRKILDREFERIKKER